MLSFASVTAMGLSLLVIASTFGHDGPEPLQIARIGIVCFLLTGLLFVLSVRLDQK